MEEFVVNFFNEGDDDLTHIYDVADITGLSYDEIRKCMETITIDTDIDEPE